ncbi:SIMPL domain-containing protein [Acinetobacter sp. MB5]|uniref:SIMPL domain-containing protein n=1 Tax=Acinetobacter sp. MB5 TaxID=2069438 RepID=UPI000DCFC2F2|nr:SIMPL domain-containing protein [Acinetobacter sp. MB5]
MRNLLVSSLILASVSSPVFAATTDALNYNVVSIQADASREVSNDQIQAVLYIEKSNKQPAELANQINMQMNQALALAKKYPQVKVKTGAQSTYPIYDTDNKKLKEWRGRAELQIQSHDFKAASQLISELQQNFQTDSIGFSVSDEQRSKIENELMMEASKNFQQRAQLMSQSWHKNGYNLINLNINTNNNYRPVMMSSLRTAKFAEASPMAQDMNAGESKISVSANGTIQLK